MNETSNKPAQTGGKKSRAAKGGEENRSEAEGGTRAGDVAAATLEPLSASFPQIAQLTEGGWQRVVRKYPYEAITASFGIGFVLAGGLLSKGILKSALSSARLLVLPAILRAATTIADDLKRSQGGESAETPAS